jgi:putative restriction endonuclease
VRITAFHVDPFFGAAMATFATCQCDLKEHGVAEQTWSQAVEDAVRRYVARTGSFVFTRQVLIQTELDRIIIDTGSTGATPHQTLSRELQNLRNVGVLEFLGEGSYRLRDGQSPYVTVAATKGVLVVGSHSIYKDEPERFYRLGPKWLTAISKLVGSWIIYQEPRRAGPRGYYATARIKSVVADPVDDAMYLALIEPGSFLEFGRDVPFQLDGRAIEQGLLYPNGRLNNGRAIQSVRSITDEDFNRIVDLGLVSSDELLPRQDDFSTTMLREEQTPWIGPTDRTTMLVNRSVRDRQFRKRVLGAYDSRCALTGMKLINGGGRAETQAAHIMSVEAGGPDIVTNGIALSGTIHWMFDRGLITLSDDGDILLSRKINDRESAERLIFSDRKARFPDSPASRPHPRYLSWHRTECFHH